MQWSGIHPVLCWLRAPKTTLPRYTHRDIHTPPSTTKWTYLPPDLESEAGGVATRLEAAHRRHLYSTVESHGTRIQYPQFLPHARHVNWLHPCISFETNLPWTPGASCSFPHSQLLMPCGKLANRNLSLPYWPCPVLIELNKAWVRVLLAFPSPYWAKWGLGKSLIGLNQSLLN